jgi:general secretion pathway protein D
VDREDVGVKMIVQPQINEGDYVAMNIEVEVSQPVNSTVGIDPNQVGATFQKSQVINRVVIKDGTTGVIGGLISASRDSTRTQTPLLGDVPVVGWLFRNKASSRLKRNLVVLLTPHIVKEGMDLDRQTRFRIQEFTDANVDALFEKGFIKRIKSKNELRNRRSPSGEAITDLSENSFGRGTVPR